MDQIMALAKSIRIFLADGSPAGIRHAEIDNWTGQGLSCPRSRVSELQKWGELSRPGVYLLITAQGAGLENKVYIGESENVAKRISQHVRERENWNEVVAFTSKDQNLTKAHIKHLESKLISLAIEAGRCEVENGNSPPLPNLPRADVASNGEYLEKLRILLATLGHRFLESILSVRAATSSTELDSTNPVLAVPMTFFSSAWNASGLQTDEGFVVSKGSHVKKDASESTPAGVVSLRNNAIENGTLVGDGGRYKLLQDILFSSPSAAASFVSGSSRNGRDTWKNAKGKSIKELEEDGLDNAESSIEVA